MKTCFLTTFQTAPDDLVKGVQAKTTKCATKCAVHIQKKFSFLSTATKSSARFSLSKCSRKRTSHYVLQTLSISNCRSKHRTACRLPCFCFQIFYKMLFYLRRSWCKKTTFTLVMILVNFFLFLMSQQKFIIQQNFSKVMQTLDCFTGEIELNCK